MNVKRHHGATLADLLQVRERDALNLGVNRGFDICPCLRSAEQVVKKVGQLHFIGGARQIIILRMLQSGLSVIDVVVANHLRRQVALRIGAVVKAAHFAVLGQFGVVASKDQPSVNMHLLINLAGVVRVFRQGAGVDHLLVSKHRQQRRKQGGCDQKQPADGSVHEGLPAAAVAGAASRASRAVRARCELVRLLISTSRASEAKLETMELPP